MNYFALFFILAHASYEVTYNKRYVCFTCEPHVIEIDPSDLMYIFTAHRTTEFTCMYIYILIYAFARNES